MGISEHKCEVCNEQYSKYKCPLCLLKYCCLHCYKTHKDSKCQPIERGSQNDGSNVPIVKNKSGDGLVIEDTDRVGDDQLEEVWKSKEIQTMLKNKHLLNLIQQLDSSATPCEDLQKFLKLSIFKEFARKCVRMVDKVDENLEKDMYS